MLQCIQSILTIRPLRSLCRRAEIKRLLERNMLTLHAVLWAVSDLLERRTLFATVRWPLEHLTTS